MSHTLTISGFSTARFATWFFLDEPRLLFDVGDGAAAHLGSKCNRVRHVFLSHADRDHLGGLIQFYQLSAAGPNPPTFYYPKDSGSFPAVRDFLERFDPNLPNCNWVPVEGGMRVDVGKHLIVEIGENDHIRSASRGAVAGVRSLDFSLIEERRKLRSEFAGLPGVELGRLRAEHGDRHISEVLERRLFGFSGDTPAFDTERWKETEVLLHEATFIAPDEADRGHSQLQSVLAAASEQELKALVLTHFSSRYRHEEICHAIRDVAESLDIRFTVYAVLPGQVAFDILGQEPVWPGC